MFDLATSVTGENNHSHVTTINDERLNFGTRKEQQIITSANIMWWRYMSVINTSGLSWCYRISSQKKF